ncbi:hypothetical protein TRVL_10241 [Trypanosoma vivax]|nr:hypothetical protein TRVL_10241 [Trypanosoma vivax]
MQGTPPITLACNRATLSCCVAAMVGRAAWRACARTPFKKSGGARSLLEIAIPLSPSAPNHCVFSKDKQTLLTSNAPTRRQGIVLCLGGSQAHAICQVKQDWGGQEANGYQRGSMQHNRHSGANGVLQILPCPCVHAASDARWLLLLISGDVERNPGPQIRET